MFHVRDTLKRHSHQRKSLQVKSTTVNTYHIVIVFLTAPRLGPEPLPSRALLLPFLSFSLSKERFARKPIGTVISGSALRGFSVSFFFSSHLLDIFHRLVSATYGMGSRRTDAPAPGAEGKTSPERRILWIISILAVVAWAGFLHTTLETIHPIDHPDIVLVRLLCGYSEYGGQRKAPYYANDERQPTCFQERADNLILVVNMRK